MILVLGLTSYSGSLSNASDENMADKGLPERKLSIKELKKISEFESLDDTEAEIIINDLYLLSLILHEFYNTNIS